MRFALLPALSLGLLLAACATPRTRVAAPAVAPPVAPTAPAEVKLGNPYEVFGRLYVPDDDRSYDRRGIASWYGPGFHARQTANGETYDKHELTAAHPTLPMPSWVEVTNLENNRQLVVRVNDRGPFVEGRIIDLSFRAAQLLGVDRTGLAQVRVRRVFPEGDWALVTPPLPQRGGAPRSRVEMADAVPYTQAQFRGRAPAPAAAPPAPVANTAVPPSRAPADGSARPPPSASQHWVQVAALSDQSRAELLAERLADFGPAAARAAPTGFWRVRIGPFATADAASAALARVHAGGWLDARMVMGD
ncbi:MAG: septal ring lytic transglycosylase RlpA family protein [Thermaurantiacus sp.]